MIRRTSTDRARQDTGRKYPRTVVTGLAAMCTAVLLVPPYAAARAADEQPGTRTVTKQTLTRTDDPGPAPARATSLKQRRVPSVPEESEQQGERRYRLSERLQSHRPDADAPAGAGADTEAAPRRATTDINDCMHAEDAYDRAGLVVDHFFYCQAGWYTVTEEECIFGKDGICWIVGRASFRLTTIGRGQAGDREVSFVTLMDKVRKYRDTSRFTIRTTMDCHAYAGAICEADPDNGRIDLLTGWQSVPSALFRFSSPLTGASGKDQLSWYDFTQKVALVGRNTITMGGNGFRCDSAGYLSGNRGCMFDNVVSVFDRVRAGDPDVDQSAKHIRDAQFRPHRTVPHKANKQVPGAPSSGMPLTRIFHDKKLVRENNRKARKVCFDVWGKYSERGLDCDEYPFKSTYQGAAGGDGNFSARAIAWKDNREAGTRIGAWYTTERILDSDPFYVRIRN